MQTTPVEDANPLETPVASQRLAEKIDALVARLQAAPDDQAALDTLLESTDQWLASDGLEPAGEYESITRTRLAGWLAHLSCGGTVVHYGWREGAVAAALAGAGAEVVSYLDHPARAMSAAIRHGSDQVTFDTLDQAGDCEVRMADLVVVETAGVTTTVELAGVLDTLRAGGWLAVLGTPQAAALEGFTDAGRFCFDGEEVLPSTSPGETEQLSLYRFAVPTKESKVEEETPATPETRASAPSALEQIIAGRGPASESELELRERTERVIQTPIPKQELIDWVGGGTPQTFHNIGLVNFHQLALYCRLRPDHRVLEPGCGCGRNARPLAAYLDPQRGSYAGFDIHRGAIDWATENITRVYPNVTFDFANIQNSNYNPDGAYAAAEFIFPYDSGTVDVVFMPSVFTHMTRDQLQHYATEIERVLKPGGIVMSWHFLLDDVSRRGIETGEAAIEFKDYDEVSMAMLPDNPCAAIAFDERWILECYESLGLRTQSVIHGRWSGRTDAGGYSPDYQDRVLAIKRD